MTGPHESPSLADIINGTLELAIPIAHKMGVEVVEVGRGFAATTVPAEGNGNHFGVMYSGVLFTVAEILGGAIAVASFDNSRFYPLVKDMQIAFKHPASTVVRAEASLDDAEIERIAEQAAASGKSDFVLDATITDTSGTVVATTTGIYQLRAHRKQEN